MFSSCQGLKCCERSIGEAQRTFRTVKSSGWYYNDRYMSLYIFQPICCTSQRVKSNVNSGLWVIMVCRPQFINWINISLLWEVNNVGGPTGATPRSGGVAVRRYHLSKGKSSGCALLEQLWRDTPRPRVIQVRLQVLWEGIKGQTHWTIITET